MSVTLILEPFFWSRLSSGTLLLRMAARKFESESADHQKSVFGFLAIHFAWICEEILPTFYAVVWQALPAKSLDDGMEALLSEDQITDCSLM